MVRSAAPLAVSTIETLLSACAVERAGLGNGWKEPEALHSMTVWGPLSWASAGGSRPGGGKARKYHREALTLYHVPESTLYTSWQNAALSLCPLFRGIYPQLPSAGWLAPYRVWTFYFFYFY